VINIRAIPFINLLLVSSIFLLIIGASAATIQVPIIADHTKTDLSQVPLAAINNAKTKLHIAYGHTSHGSQIITGMDGLTGFPNAPYGGSTYTFNSGGTNGALDVRDTPFSGAYDLGNPDLTSWSAATRTYLKAHPDVNVIIWSWCGEVSSASSADITTYLTLMNQLEIDYPNVKFVYMTGHLDGSGVDGNLNLRNEQIRAYARANNKILYDFADIESYDPDGLVNYMKLKANDNCDYDSNGDGTRDKNWATRWETSHPGEWYSCSAAHTQPLNANQKAYAAWWLWARLGGWVGTTPPPSVTPTPTITTVIPTPTRTMLNSIGIFRSGQWIMDYGMDGTVNRRLNFGSATDIPVVGDFNNDGTTDIGIFRSGQWIMDYGMDGTVNRQVNYGHAGYTPILGEFNNDGTTDIGVYRRGQWILDYGMDGNENYRFYYGLPTDTPVVGDFNNDGKTDIGVFRSGQWILDYGMDGTVNSRFYYGLPTDTPVVGDFNFG
jgi:hypothetical protein